MNDENTSLPPAPEPASSTSTGPDAGNHLPSKDPLSGASVNVLGLLAYAVGFLSALIILVLEQKNTFIKFHAYQSVFFSLAWIVTSVVLGILPLIGPVFGTLVNLVFFVAWILLMLKAYQGERFHLPVIGDWAEKQSHIQAP